MNKRTPSYSLMVLSSALSMACTDRQQELPSVPSTSLGSRDSRASQWVEEMSNSLRDSACARLMLERKSAGARAALMTLPHCRGGVLKLSQAARVEGDTIILQLTITNTSELGRAWRNPIILTAAVSDTSAAAARSGALVDLLSLAEARIPVTRGERSLTAAWSLVQASVDSVVQRVNHDSTTRPHEVRLLVPRQDGSVDLLLRAYASVVERGIPQRLRDTRTRQVPLPSDIAAELRSSAIRLRDEPRLSEYFARNYLLVDFAPNADPASVDRVIDDVGAEVVGFQMHYLLRFSPSTTGAELMLAKRKLEQSGAVRLVSYYDVGGAGGNHIRPNDGASWRRNDWRLDQSRNPGALWALERVNAPLAWGCQRGGSGDTVLSRGQVVGVVEQGFEGGVLAQQDPAENILPHRRGLLV